jgi:TonB-linked SusC/RagA family outer membrane protein
MAHTVLKKCIILAVATIFMGFTNFQGAVAAESGLVEVNHKLLAENLIQSIEVTGQVTDEKGEPLIGVNIIIKGTNRGTSTNIEGEYSIEVESEESVLVFNYLGFVSQEITVGEQRTINVKMEEEVGLFDEIVVIGYGEQERSTISGSVSQIRSHKIVTTPNEDPENMLSGKIPGLRVTQTGSEPGDFSTSMDIRGFGSPLFVIDGVPRDNFSRLNPEDIESISVLKDASAAVYGVRAANGVVLINTKDGSGAEGLNLTYRGDVKIQRPSGSPKMASAADWMELHNESNMRSLTNPQRPFSDEEIDAYRSGELQGTDWYGTIIRPTAPQTQHTLSAYGQIADINFYTSVGYEYQESFFRNNLSYDSFNIRSNITTQLTDHIGLDLKLSGISDSKFSSYAESWDIISAYQRSNPTIPIYANNQPPFYRQGIVDGRNPAAMMNSDYAGYRDLNDKWFQSSLTIDHALPFIEGLEARAFFSFDYHIAENKLYSPEYNQFEYDEASDRFIEIPRQGPSQVENQFFSDQDLLYQLSLEYEQTFFEAHNVKALLLGEGQRRQGDNFFAQRQLVLSLDELFAGITEDQIGNMSTALNDLYEDSNLGLVGRLQYNYDERYMAEFSFRYDGSSRFAENNRWGFFPSVSAGWRMSEESFWKKSVLSFINNARIRASYGVLGDDSASTFQFVTGYQYPNEGVFDMLPGGSVFGGNYIPGAQNLGIPNPSITWFTSHTVNFGIDLEAWDNLLGISIDVFNRDREGLLTTRVLSLPTEVGASLPQENLNEDRTRGLEVVLNHTNRVNNIFYDISAQVSYTRTQNLFVERAEAGNSYLNWRSNSQNRYQGIWWGQAADGRWNSYDEIANSDYFINQGALPGDYKYEDWNGDGQINQLDLHPISYNGVPLINFGFTTNTRYRNFNLNIHFQGAAMNYVAYDLMLLQPLWGDDQANAMDYFTDRWRPVDPNADPYDPNTKWIEGEFAFGGETPDRNSYHAINRGNYLRVKSIELGYRLPSSTIEHLGIKNARFYVSAYNLLTFTKMDYIDPEQPETSAGNTYPLNQNFTLGINLDF